MQRAPFITVLLVPLAASFALGSPAPAFAETQTRTVSLAGIDTTTPVGAEQALTRLRQAARAVCDDHTTSRSYSDWQARKTCERNALNQAVAMLDSPQVTRLADAATSPAIER